MNQPIGVTIGNALEVRESIDLLKGGGPADSREITLQLTIEMLTLSGLQPDDAPARALLTQLLDSGKALEKFIEWITAQGGDPRVVDDYSLLKVSDKIHRVKFGKGGYIQSIQTRQLGVAGNMLGAGRIQVSDNVDTTVGITCPFKVGDHVGADDEILLYHNDRNVDEVARMVREAFVLGDERVPALPLIIEEYHG